MKFSVVVFPGSNSDYDAFYAASRVVGEQAELVWHKDTDLKGADAVILPGGFAHGDYLRTGAIARFSPIMARGQGVRRSRRPGARHLQRLPGAARSRPAAGRDGAQRSHQVRVADRAGPRRADRHAVHRRLRVEAGPAPADRARRRQLLRAARRARRSSRRIARSSSATPSAAGEVGDGLRTRTARSTASPASATASATSSA